LVRADSVTLHPVADTTLFATYPTNNLGSSSWLVAGANGFSTSPRRALIRFDPSIQIPSNAVIQSVTLSLNVLLLPSQGVPSVFDLHRLLVRWEEGTGTGLSGAFAKIGETTWNTRFYPGTLWTQPGAAGGVDFSDTVSASKFVEGVGAYTFDSTANLVLDVQQWLSNPQTNFGWILVSKAENTNYTVRRFASREDSARAPSLIVEYTVPQRLIIQNIGLVGDTIQFSFPAQAGKSYTVEYRDSLESGSWLTLTNLSNQTIATNIVIVDSINGATRRCYRVGAR
jgi:hypothetical protein